MRLRTRLSLTFIVVVSPILLFLLANFYYYFSLANQDDFLIKIKNRGITMTHLLVEKQSINPSLLRRIDEDTYTAYSDRRVAIYDDRDQVLYDSGELDNRENIRPPFQITHNLLERIGTQKEVILSDGTRQGVGLLLTYQGKKYKVISYAIDDYGHTQMKEAMLVSGASFLMAFLLVLILSQLFARKSIKPIRDMIQQIDRINVSNLDARLITTNVADELSQLAFTFNQMLDRISAFEVQRSFVANASHELRTPLTLITNQIEIALINTRTVNEYKLILASLLEDMNKLNALSNGLLELAQFDVTHMQIAWTAVDLDEVLYEAAATVLQKYPSYNITFSTGDLDEALPSVQVEGEESLLKTAFINLIENGCKFSADHHSQLRVHSTDTKIHVSVQDQGMGIAPGELNYIFQPFYRASNARTIKGNGIGLSLTEKIIKLHRGTIVVQSELTKGTTFIVQLPRHLTNVRLSPPLFSS